MPSRTVFLCRLIGLYCILVALAMIMHRQATVETVTALVRSAPLMFLLGVMTLAAGLAMVLVHNVWSGSAWTVVVTVVGWLALAKGLLFIFLPPPMEARFFLGQLHYEQLFYVYAAISLLLGVFLAYGGFKAVPRS